MTQTSARAPTKGFTLVELLVALGIMSVLALMGWRGIDGLLRTQSVVRDHMNQVSVLQTGLAQWSADLEAMIALAPLPALDFDGRVLRLVRVDHGLPGRPLRVVTWSRRSLPQVHGGRGSWVRWQSPPLSDASSLALAWQRAAQASPAEAQQQEVAIVGLQGWQVYYFRQNAWSHPLSSAGNEPERGSAAAQASPDAIRLVLQLSDGQALQGDITIDWLRPASATAP